ncbi:uncharacterized protein EDB93DRAFT_1103306 [Suillus bovinus]|uniref:uncharacterized protein n=1 Tax=Suillus bovinus TaxID=48563 RepID=UPI001B880BBD|nr:uncharacterized protein EDB93DRAFT_1103306 [Suillus bovinus]KAG2151097.1 hypothetical protein EDB93DRAFT_1103306 [Suillus bovinus]
MSWGGFVAQVTTPAADFVMPMLVSIKVHFMLCRDTKKTKYTCCFSQTGAGIDLSQPNASNNLLEQVILEFPWYSALDDIWGHNPAYAPKTFSSTPRVNHAGDMIVLMSKHKGKEKEVPPDLDNEAIETTDDGLSPPAPTINIPPAPTINAPPAPATNAPPTPAVNTPPAPAINAPVMDAPPTAPHLNPLIDYYTLEDDHFLKTWRRSKGTLR